MNSNNIPDDIYDGYDTSNYEDLYEQQPQKAQSEEKPQQKSKKGSL